MSLFASPELTLHQSVKFVAGAYAVLLALILIYVGIMALRLKRNERDLQQLQRELLARDAAEQTQAEREPIAK